MNNNIKELVNDIKECIFECYDYMNILDNLKSIKENVIMLDKIDKNYYHFEYIKELIEDCENHYKRLEKYVSDNNRNNYYNTLYELMFHIVDIERNNNYFD